MSKNKKDSAATIFTRVRVTPLKQDNLLGLASVLVADSIMITGIRVLEGKNGHFVSMPARKQANGEYQDVAFPISKEVRQLLAKTILDEYEKASAQAAEVGA